MGIVSEGTKFQGETFDEDAFLDEASTATDDTADEAVDTEPVAAEPAETAEPEPTGDEVPRDEQGRFAKKAADDDAAKGDEPVTQPATDAAAEPQAAAEPEAAKAPAQPFTLKVSGKEYHIPEAEYVPGVGLAIPDKHVQEIRGYIQEGLYYKQNWKTLEETAEKRGYERAVQAAPEVAQAKALLAQLDQVLADPDKLAEFYNNLTTQGPLLRERAMRTIAEQQLQELRQGSQRDQQEAELHQLEQQKQASLTETVGEMRAHPEFKALAAEDWEWVDSQIALMTERGALFVEQNGEVFLDVPAIERIGLHALKVRQQALQVAKKAEEAARFNAAQRAQPPAAARQSGQVTPRKGSAKPEGSAKPAKRDYRDVLEDALSGKLDFEEA